MAYPGTYEAALKLVPTNKEARIIDLGCGTGHIVRELRKKGFKHIDYADLEDRFDGKVRLMDFDKNLAYEDKSFDVVISTEVVEHLQNKYHYFREVYRILKPGGTFIFTTPNLANIPNRFHYAIKKKFIEFNEKEQKEETHGHINPFFLWQIPRFFSIEKIGYNRGYIPLLRIPFFNGPAFGQSIAIRCTARRKADV